MGTYEKQKENIGCARKPMENANKTQVLRWDMQKIATKTQVLY